MDHCRLYRKAVTLVPFQLNESFRVSPCVYHMSRQAWTPPANCASESPIPDSSEEEKDYVMAEASSRHRVPTLVTIMENHRAYSTAFNLGQIAMDTNVSRWRRMVLTMLFRRLWHVKNTIMKTKYALSEGQTTGDCQHPIEAHRRGGNRYGTYVHCAVCRQRIEYTKHSAPLKGKKSQREALNKARESQEGQPHEPPKLTKKDRAAAEAAVLDSQRHNRDMAQVVNQTLSAPLTQMVEAIAASAQQSASSNETVTQMLAMSIQQQQQASSMQQQTNAAVNQALNQLVGQQAEVLQVIRQQDAQDHKKKKGAQ